MSPEGIQAILRRLWKYVLFKTSILKVLNRIMQEVSL